MPRQGKESGETQDRERVLNAPAYRAHNAHVKVGQRRSQKCGFCQQGVGALVTERAKEVWPPPVDEDSGSDKEGSASHTHGDGDSAAADGYVHRETPWWEAEPPI